MKVSKIVLALVAATLSSAALASNFTEFKTASGGKMIVYNTTITPAILNENKDVQFDMVIEHRPLNGNPLRQEHTASCTESGGRYAVINDKGEIVGAQKIWVAGGPTVADQLFSHACVVSVEKLEAASAKQNRSAPSGYTPGSKPGKFAL
jgi:hypothetical protein